MLLLDRTRLEMLNLSQNRINDVGGLGSVPSLVALNLGEYGQTYSFSLKSPRRHSDRIRKAR